MTTVVQGIHTNNYEDRIIYIKSNCHAKYGSKRTISFTAIHSFPNKYSIDQQNRRSYRYRNANKHFFFWCKDKQQYVSQSVFVLFNFRREMLQTIAFSFSKECVLAPLKWPVFLKRLQTRIATASENRKALKENYRSSSLFGETR